VIIERVMYLDIYNQWHETKEAAAKVNVRKKLQEVVTSEAYQGYGEWDVDKIMDNLQAWAALEQRLIEEELAAVSAK
jgi:hypothetical protein